MLTLKFLFKVKKIELLDTKCDVNILEENFKKKENGTEKHTLSLQLRNIHVNVLPM